MPVHRSYPKKYGFRLGIYVCKDAEIVDFAAPHGVFDAGRIVSGGGIASGMEVGFHLLRRAGYDEAFIADVARVMENTAAYDVYRDDVEYAD